MRSRLIAALFFVFLLSPAGKVAAHPLGNFSISQYSAIRINENEIELRYIIDMAEIPTFQEIQENEIAPTTGDSSVETYLKRKAETLRDGLRLEVNGQRLTPSAESREIIFPPGAGSLPTMKIGILYKAKLTVDSKASEYLLSYRDNNFAGRAGWKEIIAITEAGAKILNSSVPEVDRSSQLNNYPTDLLNSPPQELEAKVAFTTGAMPASVAAMANSRIDAGAGEKASPVSKVQIRRSEQSASKMEPVKQPAHTPTIKSAVIDAGSTAANVNSPAQLQANRQATPRNSFTELMATEQLGLGIILIALTVAVGLGAFHALEPGHGKTLVAAYLVGSRGTVKHAFLLGLIVTAAHTAGVYLLGAVTLYASRYIVPEQLYPWLGVVSGVMITSLGAVLLVRRYRDKDGLSNHHHHHRRDHSHCSDDHDHHHHHPSHHNHSHDHGHTHQHHSLNRQVSLRELLTLGISGGIVPCPAALVVLLSAVSMQRIGFGLLLIVAFSIGLAAVLIAIGLLMVYAREFMSRFQTEGQVFTRWLPLASSTLITIFGFGLMIQSVASAGYFVR
jgi:ABC-type nickel/cobalt efflux system permease component RcnA